MIGGWIVELIAMIAAAAGATVLFAQRKTLQVRRWVIWTFIVLDVVIVLSLLLGLLG